MAANFNNRPLLVMDPGQAAPATQQLVSVPPGQQAPLQQPQHPAYAPGPRGQFGPAVQNPPAFQNPPSAQPQPQQPVMGIPVGPPGGQPQGSGNPSASLLTPKNLAAAAAEAANHVASASVVQPPSLGQSPNMGNVVNPYGINATPGGTVSTGIAPSLPVGNSELDNHKRTMTAVQKWVDSIEPVRLEEDALTQMMTQMEAESEEGALAPTIAWTQQQQYLMQQPQHQAHLQSGIGPGGGSIPSSHGGGKPAQQQQHPSNTVMDPKDPVYTPKPKAGDQMQEPRPEAVVTKTLGDTDTPTAQQQQQQQQPAPAQPLMQVAPQPTYYHPQLVQQQQQQLAQQQLQHQALQQQQQQQMVAPAAVAQQQLAQPQMQMQPQYFCYVQQVQGADGSIQYMPVAVTQPPGQQPGQPQLAMQQPQQQLQAQPGQLAQAPAQAPGGQIYYQPATQPQLAAQPIQMMAYQAPVGVPQAQAQPASVQQPAGSAYTMPLPPQQPQPTAQ